MEVYERKPIIKKCLIELMDIQKNINYNLDDYADIKAFSRIFKTLSLFTVDDIKEVMSINNISKQHIKFYANVRGI
jgi:hypothetical protein